MFAKNRIAQRLLLVFLAAACAPPGALAAANDVQPGYESAGLPRAEFLIGDLRGFTGKKFWIRRPAQGQAAIALFCDNAAPPTGKDCPREKFSVAGPEQFIIEDAVIAKPNPGQSWFKIRFDSGKTGFLSLQDFVQHRYNEGRVSVALFGLDYALANSGWIFDDYPPRILDQRRAQFEATSDPKRAQEKLENERIARLKLLYIGMSAQQVLNSTWGPPNSVTTTVQGWRRLEQWDYGSAILTFENDRLYRMEVVRR